MTWLPFCEYDPGSRTIVVGTKRGKAHHGLTNAGCYQIKSWKSRVSTLLSRAGGQQNRLFNLDPSNHLVGGWALPLWKIWVHQFGVWNSQYVRKVIQNSVVPVTTNQSSLVVTVLSSPAMEAGQSVGSMGKNRCKTRNWSPLDRWWIRGESPRLHGGNLSLRLSMSIP